MGQGNRCVNSWIEWNNNGIEFAASAKVYVITAIEYVDSAIYSTALM